MPRKRKGIKYKWFSYDDKKSYKSMGWAKRKVKSLKVENVFNRKYGRGYDPTTNHRNTNIKIIQRGKRFIVTWKNSFKIPIRK